MLEMMDVGLENTVAYRVSGKITDDEMILALSTIKEKLAVYGYINIYQEVETIGGVELEAIVEKFKFLTEVGLSKIRKIAVVTDKKWMQKIIRLEDKIFKNIELESFSFSHKDAAITFLKED